MVIRGGLSVASAMVALVLVSGNDGRGTAAAGDGTVAHQHAATHGNSGGYLEGHGRVAAHPRWVRPATLRDAVRQSTAVVRAEVVSVAPSEPMVVKTVESRHRFEIPTERVTFRRLETVMGEGPEEFEVHRTGSASFNVEGDPGYGVGDTHLLILQTRPDGLLIPVGPDGRFRERADRLEAAIDGGAAAELHGLSKGEAKTKIKKAMEDR